MTMLQIRLVKCAVALVMMLMLTACNSSLIGGSSAVYYETSAGDKIPAVKIDAPDGRTFYAVRLPAMSYQQTYSLQHDGWVLPRMYGARTYDEHRMTTMPTFELLLKEKLLASDTDATSVIFQAMDGEMKKLMDDSDQIEQNYWTTTLTPNKGRFWNYVLGYNKSTNTCEYRIADQEEVKDVILMKDAALLTDTIRDQDYRIGDGQKIQGELYEAADGYDYYVVTLRDSMYTWSEAVSMERDGWVMPRCERKTLEVAPTVEGLLGNHPIHSSMALTRQMKHLFPVGMWTASADSEDEAFLLGSNFFAPNTVGMFIKNKREKKIGVVTLVKRIPAQTDQHYAISDAVYAQAKRVDGDNGSYYIVDPSGWLGTKYEANELKKLEKDGWHVMTLEEFNDMLGLHDDDAATPGIDWPRFEHRLFRSVLPAGHTFYATLENGDLIQVSPYFHTYAHNEWGLSVHGVINREAQVRLIKEADSDAEVAPAVTANDAQMYGLKGHVYTIKVSTYAAGQTEAGYFESYPISTNVLDVSFNKNGQVTRDHQGNTYRYDKDGTFRSGNHDYTKVKRDKEGRIVSYDDSQEIDDEGNYVDSYSYDSKGRVIAVSHSGWSENYEIVYTYDKEGRLVKESTTGTYEGGGEFERIREFQYEKFDDEGNWTERYVICNSIEKDEDDAESSTSQEVVYEKRDIKYFK